MATALQKAFEAAVDAAVAELLDSTDAPQLRNAATLLAYALKPREQQILREMLQTPPALAEIARRTKTKEVA